MTKIKKEQYNFRLPTDLMEAVQKQAEKEVRYTVQLVQVALQEYLEKRGVKLK